MISSQLICSSWCFVLEKVYCKIKFTAVSWFHGEDCVPLRNPWQISAPRRFKQANRFTGEGSGKAAPSSPRLGVKFLIGKTRLWNLIEALCATQHEEDGRTRLVRYTERDTWRIYWFLTPCKVIPNPAKVVLIETGILGIRIHKESGIPTTIRIRIPSSTDK